MTVRAQLVDAEGTVRSESDFAYEVFPAATTSPARIALAGDGADDRPARRLARSLGLEITPLESANDDVVLVVDSLADFAARKEALLERVAGGARLVLLETAPGRYELPGGPVEVVACGMRGRIFASRQTGHPLVEGFAPDDFKWWYHAGEDCVLPQVPCCFPGAEGWQPILTTGQGNWGQTWQRALVDGEYRHGRGSIVLSTLRLADFVEAVPTARRYAGCLLGR